MTKQEYADYQATVAEFFSHGLQNLSTKSDDNGTCEPFFSWSPCDCCGTHLGGDRYECNGYNAETKEIEEYNCVCGDCVYYAEYGQLDDTTMDEIDMNEMTKEACRLLFECMNELRLHDDDPNHVTHPGLKERLQAFMVKHGFDSPKEVVDKLCIDKPA